SQVSGSIAFAKTGAGTVVLANPNNNYSHGTYLGGGFDGAGNPIPGILQAPSDVATASATPTSDFLGAVPATASYNIFLNGGILQFTSSTTVATNRKILLSGMGGGIDTMANTVSYAGAIDDSGNSSGTAVSFTKLGPGALILTGRSGYRGATNIAGGTLSFTATSPTSGALGTGGPIV